MPNLYALVFFPKVIIHAQVTVNKAKFISSIVLSSNVKSGRFLYIALDPFVANNRNRFSSFAPSCGLNILGDPGAVSGDGKKSKRVRKNSGEKSQEGEEEPLGTRF